MDATENAQTTDHGPPERTDGELIAAARRGQREAFHCLVDRYAPYLMHLAAALVGNAADAEDVVQETLAGAFRGLGGYQERSSVKTWLTRILVRQAAAIFRRRGPRRLIRFAEAGAAEPATPSTQHGSDARMDVQAAILALRSEHREVIVLREMQGLSYEQIAQALGVPRGTVESRLFRARRELQELLRDYLPGS